MHADGGGLYLQVTKGKSGLNRSWLYRFERPEIVASKNGKPRKRTRDMGLGPVATISLHEAREKARQLRQLRLDGIDPIEDRKAKLAEQQQEAARVKTFEECALGYV